MGFDKPFGRILRKYCFFLFLFAFTVPGKSQNIFLSETPGLFTFGEFSQVQKFDGPAIGLNYSFNGQTAVGLRYGSGSLNGQNYQSVRVSANHLVKSQTDGDLFNVEVVPAFERKYHDLSGNDLSLFTFGTGISRNFSEDTSLHFIPRLSLSYLVSPSVGVTNFLSTGVDLGVGFTLTNNVKLIVNPGLNLRMDNGRVNGVFTSGLLIY